MANNSSNITYSGLAFTEWTPYNQIVVSTPNGSLDELNINTEFTEPEEFLDEYTFGSNASSGDFVKGWGAK